jgi:uncharacterized protein with HEPN domain
MPRDYKVYLDDIIQAVAKIEQYTSALTQANFSKDEKTLDAVVRNLEIIGEAVKKLPEIIRSKHPNVDWKKIAGLRDILIHEYYGIDVEIIWDIIKNKLPVLAKQVQEMLKD